MSAVGDTSGKLDLGRVIQQLFSVLGRNFATFAILAVLLAGVPTAVLYGLMGDLLARNGDPSQIFGPRLGWFFLGALVTGLFGVIMQATIIYGTVSDLNERKVSLADSLSVGLRAFLPILGLGILMGLAIMLGFILLIVPGLMLAIAWCVAVPAYVVEQPGIIGAFGRSAALTRGNRWRIFGLFVIYIVAAFVVQLVVNMIGGVTNLATIGGSGLVNRIVLLPLIQVITLLISSTGVAVLYVELRRLRDGVGPAGLAAIFD
jgi:hypothetical protein